MIHRPQHTERLGQRLGSLRLERLIGEGGMGSVYEAWCSRRRRSVAVKILHPELARDPLICARFHREARIASSLESEHIVSVRDFARTEDGTPYLVMDLLEGHDLRRIFAREAPLAGARVIDLISQACRGLRVTHNHKPAIIHRDLKPENLFICRDERGNELVKVLDFGIAKILWPVDSATHTGCALGTPHYMSPEQAEGVTALDQRTDIYSLGCILYEALSGHKAHPGATYNQVISHILLKSPIPLGRIRTDLSTELVGIVHRAMRVDPADRYQTVEELNQALLGVRHTASSSVRSISEAHVTEPQEDKDLQTVALAPEPELEQKNDSLTHEVEREWPQADPLFARSCSNRDSSHDATYSVAGAAMSSGRQLLAFTVTIVSLVAFALVERDASRDARKTTIPSAPVVSSQLVESASPLRSHDKSSTAVLKEPRLDANTDESLDGDSGNLLVDKTTKKTLDTNKSHRRGMNAGTAKRLWSSDFETLPLPPPPEIDHTISDSDQGRLL